jgi:hypothetical protein
MLASKSGRCWAKAVKAYVLIEVGEVVSAFQKLDRVESVDSVTRFLLRG